MQLIRKTPGVTRFIGAGRQPTALNEDEIQNILKATEDRQTKPTPKVVFENGEPVRVIDGPFVNFNGTVDSVHPDKGKLKVSVSVFGRATPIELEYWQVEKI
jgi:transcriptional antiterminator NusG